MQYFSNNMIRTVLITIFFVQVSQANGTPDSLPSTCRNFSFSTVKKSYLPLNIININASCYAACPSWDISSYPYDFSILANYTAVQPDGRCVRSMSIQIEHFDNANAERRNQVDVIFSIPENEPSRIINVEKSDDGESCRQDWDCYHTAQQCTYGYCACRSGYSFVNHLGKCYPAVSRYYGACQYTEQCQGTRSICKNSVCQCPEHFILDFNYMKSINCLPEGRSIGESCATDNNCQQKDVNAWCTSGRCACKYIYYNSNGTCLASGRSIGEYCATDEICQLKDINTWCNYGRCACKYNYYNSYGTCRPSGRSIGESCATDESCQETDFNTWCFNGYCACKFNYSYSNGTCRASGRSIGESCATDESCQEKDVNARCFYGYCACKFNYTYSYGTCRASEPSIGEYCATDEICQLKDINTWCNYGYCACKYNYSISNGTCRPSGSTPTGRSIGEYCATDEICQLKDINTWCNDGYCACTFNYSYSYGACGASENFSIATNTSKEEGEAKYPKYTPSLDEPLQGYDSTAKNSGSSRFNCAWSGILLTAFYILLFAS